MKKLLLSVALLVGAVSAARADVIDLSAGDHSAAIGLTQYSIPVSGLTLTLNTGYWSGLSSIHDQKLSWNQNGGQLDGFGVTSTEGFEADEIEKPEALFVWFSQAVVLNRVRVSNLFTESRNGHTYSEQGFMGVFGGSTVSFTADAGNLPGSTNGEQWIDVHQELIPGNGNGHGFYLSAILNIPAGEDHEFTLQGLDFTVKPVPEPGTIALLGVGLFGLVARRMRRQA
jgi:hypothetical protein